MSASLAVVKKILPQHRQLATALSTAGRSSAFCDAAPGLAAVCLTVSEPVGLWPGTRCVACAAVPSAHTRVQSIL